MKGTSRRDWICGLLLVLAVVLVYQPVWQAGFIWDDDDHFTANPCIVGPLGLKEIWTTSHARYYPLVLTTFWLEHALWGLNPLLFHLVNVLVQGACAVSLWRVLIALRVPGAWFGAALWALHPVQVESVAWVTELKNVQSALFYLLSILFFVRHLRAVEKIRGEQWAYPLTLLFAAMAMLSKSSTVTLPIVLCLCAWWIDGRWHWRNLIKVGPVFLMAVASALMAVGFMADRGQLSHEHATRSLAQRLITSGDVFWFYLGKLAWPHPLIFIYPRWQIDATQVLSYVPLVAMMGVLLLVWSKRETWGRPWFFALAYFVAALLPVLGLLNHYFLGFSFVSDHLQYLASMGPLALAGAGLSRGAEAVLPANASLRSALGGGLLLVLGILSWQQVHIYKNNDILWADTLAKNPTCWLAQTNTAMALTEKGKVDEAKVHYLAALQYNSEYPEGRYNLGQVYFNQGHVADAIAQYRIALQLRPDFVLARINLGWALTQSGRPDDGLAQYQKALETNPHYGLAHYYIGLALVQKGRNDEAMAEFREAVEDDPGLFEAHYNLGLALSQKGQVDEAIEQFEEAVGLNPASAAARNNLGFALLQKGQVPDAIAEIQQALVLEPGMVGAHFNLGNAYLAATKVDGAITEFETVVKLSPSYADAHNNLAVALFESGRLEEAVAQFQEFVRLNPGDLNAQKNLAKAQELLAHQKTTGGK